MRIKIHRSKKPKANPKNAVFVVYKILNIILPIGLLLLIRADLIELSIVLVLFSKWRVLSVQPQHVMANIRANAVDIVVKVSALTFMIQASSLNEQLAWTAWYIAWLILIKPGSSKKLVTLQAAVAQLLGISATFLFSNNWNDLIILSAVWIISQSAARHFLSSYEETNRQLVSQLWALFALNMAWVLNKWTLVYLLIPQLILIVGVVGYALGSMYDMHKKDKLKKSFIRQQVIVSMIIIFVIIVLSDWSGNI